jgi:hypothetical protein
MQLLQVPTNLQDSTSRLTIVADSSLAKTITNTNVGTTDYIIAGVAIMVMTAIIFVLFNLRSRGQ